ncbi:hypothetical protein CP880_00490 [Cutibacterium namnetense]|uniref:Uncharacterized protein n=1 Tax=Cutibacterium namnetense TaxID=1574624 RepID=A0ABX9IAM1_9ACTN|nr:hypothetical protein CP880_00490 [Cutibacterium namnetense]
MTTLITVARGHDDIPGCAPNDAGRAVARPLRGIDCEQCSHDPIRLTSRRSRTTRAGLQRLPTIPIGDVGSRGIKRPSGIQSGNRPIVHGLLWCLGDKPITADR